MSALTEDDVRALMLEHAKMFIGRKGSLGLRRWAEHHGIPKSRVSEVMAGKRRPNSAILDALGLEWRIVRKRMLPAKATP